MFLDVSSHMAYRVMNSQPLNWPFDHLCIGNVFPDTFYDELLHQIPSLSVMDPINKKRPVNGYEQRFISVFDEDWFSRIQPDQSAFWRNLVATITSGFLKESILGKFGSLGREARSIGKRKIREELLLVCDTDSYALGPHTDSRLKLATAVFYLPRDDRFRELGTSIYLPNHADFRCQGGPHYNHQDFMRVHTVPYVPNSALIFLKSDRSFHGVEKINLSGCERWVLIYDLYMTQ